MDYAFTNPANARDELVAGPYRVPSDILSASFKSSFFRHYVFFNWQLPKLLKWNFTDKLANGDKPLGTNQLL